jgi:hypothetical protein
MTPNLLARNASVILGLFAAVPGFSKTPGAPHIRVRVFDYVNLPSGAHAELQANAKRILGQAGVPVEFVECLRGGMETGVEVCHGQLGPFDFNLRIFQPKLAVRGEQLGYAAMTPDDGAFVTVFINPAERKARALSLSDGAFLGHAVAHEIGHLLLGPNSHSSSGIMRPVIRELDEEWMAKGLLLFSADQAQRMQANLMARLGR